MMLLGMHPFEFSAQRPNAAGYFVSRCKRRIRFALADNMPRRFFLQRKLHEQVRVGGRDRQSQDAVLEFVQSLQYRATDDGPQFLGDDHFVAADPLAVSMQSLMFAGRRQILVITGGMDLMVPAAKAARI